MPRHAASARRGGAGWELGRRPTAAVFDIAPRRTRPVWDEPSAPQERSQQRGSGFGSRLETLARRCLWLEPVALDLASGRRSSTRRSAEEEPEGVGGAVDVLVAAAEAPLEQLDAKHEAAHVRRHACTDWRRAPEDGRRRRRSSGFRRSTTTLKINRAQNATSGARGCWSFDFVGIAEALTFLALPADLRAADSVTTSSLDLRALSKQHHVLHPRPEGEACGQLPRAQPA